MSDDVLHRIRMPTGSKIHRIVKCPASAVLPWDTDERQECATAPARAKGTAVHAFLEQVKALGRAEALARIADPVVARLCAALDLDNLPSHLATEVAMAWNWRTRTARYLGQNLGHRDYATLSEPPTDDEIALTADVMGVAPMGDLALGYVGDYKTGHTRYPRPGVFGQTLIAACCARQLLPADEMVLELLYLDDGGQCFPVRDRVDGWVLDAFEQQLAAVMDSLPGLRMLAARGAAIAAHAGDHCQHCGAYKHCSATTGLVRALPQQILDLGIPVGEGALAPESRPLLTHDTAGRVYVQIERLEDALAAIKAEICDLGWHAPVPLPDGRVIEPVETTKRAVDAKIAFAVLEARYGRDTAVQATEFKITIDALKTAVAAHLDPAAKPRQTVEGKHGVLPAVLAEIDRRQGLTTTTSRACRPRHPKKKPPAR